MKTILFAFLLASSVNCFAQLTVTEVHYPQYVQGVGTGNPPDDRKVPFACRMTISGLLPNATYRYYSRFVQDPALATNGQGFYIIANKTGNFTRITSATLGVAGRYGEFTTNGTGSATDWFIVEPSSAIDYQPGIQLYWRIMMNNGAGGVSVVNRATATSPVTVLGFGSTPTQGTGLRITPVAAYTAKNFVVLYDNEAGTGRPVAGTFIESDGTDNNAGANGYAPFYGNSVDGVDKTWGTIIPNNLATGVRNITEFALATGNSVNVSTSADGIYPTIPSGTISTANATGGLTELVIGSTIVLPVTLVSFTGDLLHNGDAKLTWTTAEEINAASFMVQKSTNGLGYNTFATVAPKGNNSTYHLEDKADANTVYYRLKMVDRDGNFKYSKVIVLQPKLNNSLSLFPNPAINRISITHPKANTDAAVKIFTMNGSVVLRQIIAEGSIQNTIEISKLPPGKYFLVFINNKQTAKAAFTKQ